VLSGTRPAQENQERLRRCPNRRMKLDSSIERSESAANLGHGWVCQRRPVMEDDGRHGQISVINVSDNRSTIGMIFDVDFSEVDTGAVQLGLEPYAVATPAGGENSWLVCTHQIHSHVIHNRAVRARISVGRIAFVTLLWESFAQMDAHGVTFLLVDQLA
jgi:hypothetical protein